MLEWAVREFTQPVLVVHHLTWLVLMLPLAGFLVLAAFNSWFRRDREETGAAILACATVVLAFLTTAWVGWQFSKLEADRTAGRVQHERFLAKTNVAPEERAEILDEAAPPFVGTPYFPSSSAVSPSVDWIRVGGVTVPFALLIDRLSLLMMLVVSGVGALIHIYSLGYMAHDPDRVRYFSYLNLFTFFMLLLVTAGSLPLMFVGWEGVGLCSYLLIGFWYKKPSAADAGKKAFIVNRIGDAGLILGTILVFHTLGTFDLVRITDAARGWARAGLTQQVAALAPEALGTFGPLTAIGLLLFVGACGKSAQIPLHVWLPDAMEGPTPVSALIHAATMVTAGVYMVVRLSPLYVKAPTAMLVIALVGLATALMAASVALVQTDIKRVLAYSTVSQLGYMFMACGVGAFGAAIFHLYTHAFFKALLFLGAGSVIHALSGQQDMRRMGGLWRRVPVTFVTFVVATAAIAGVPGLSGFFSKEAILAATAQWPFHGDAAGAPAWIGIVQAAWPAYLAIGIAVAGLTAFYMARLVFLTFFGRFRGSEEERHHLHESPWVMLIPLVLLAAGAAGAAGAGYLNVPHLLEPAVAHAGGEHHVGLWLPATTIVLALLAMVSAGYFYLLFTGVPGWAARRFPRLVRALEAKWGFDDLFNWIARRVVVGGSASVLWRRVDAAVIDGAVNGTARLVAAVAVRVRTAQTGLVRGYALVMFGGAVLLLAYLVWR